MPEPLKSTGMTITFGSVDPAYNILSIKPVGGSVADVDITHIGSTVKSWVPGTIMEFTPAEITVQLDPDKDLDSHVGVSQTITMTFPKYNSGASSGAIQSFTGYISKTEPAETGIDEIFTAKLTIQPTGDVTYTAEV